jgi:predicted TIM-barrel fold metal-dependent hydrolase
MITRRSFLGAIGASLTLPRLNARELLFAADQGQPSGEWGSPVLDLHFHMRAQPAQNLAHLDGAGIAKANLLTRATAAEQVAAVQAAAPGRFTWFASADIAQPAGVEALTQAVKSGARGFGEMNLLYATDGPEFRRAYALAADLNVPILIHFQEVDHFEGEGTWSSGFAAKFESVLKAYPKTTFIGHADAFWANVSADYRNEAAYPAGPIVRGGVTDRLLGDYPTLYGDLSANSGNNMLSRDAAFTREFLSRHQDKLLFGSDCGCTDGHGAGISQGNNPAAARLAGKCVARETLTVLKRSTSDAVFRKITWDNVHKLLKIPPQPVR